MTFIAEYVLLAINAVLLLLEGVSDKKIRGIPYWLVLLHATLALVSVALRYGYLDTARFIIVYTAIGLLVIALALVYVLTGFVGEGDIAVIAFSSVVTPYVPLSYLSKIPIVPPLAIVTSATYLAYRYSKTTRIVHLKGMGKVRARVRYAIDFKHGLLGSEIPIYVDGYGAISPKIRRNLGYLKELISRMPDYTIVYSVPNYPYVYYYSISFILIYSTLFVVSLLLSSPVT